MSVSYVFRRKSKLEKNKDNLIIMGLDIGAFPVDFIAEVFNVSVEYVLAVKATLDEEKVSENDED